LERTLVQRRRSGLADRSPLRRIASAFAKAAARPRRSAYGAKAGRSRGRFALLAAFDCRNDRVDFASVMASALAA
jgi:hypothetical protein